MMYIRENQMREIRYRYNEHDNDHHHGRRRAAPHQEIEQRSTGRTQ